MVGVETSDPEVELVRVSIEEECNLVENVHSKLLVFLKLEDVDEVV